MKNNKKFLLKAELVSLKKKLYIIVIFYFFLYLGLHVTGCGKSKENIQKLASKEIKPAYGDILIDSSIGDASILNPVLLTDGSSGDIAGLVFNGLVKYDKDIKITGDLAEKWEVSKDGLVITFYLRKNVKWHDGLPFTAEDVKFTYDKLVDPLTKTPYSSSYTLIKNAEVLDKYTFRVTYKKPFAPALESWGIGILPKHLLFNVDINNTPFNRNPVGTGPYVFKRWKTAEKIVLFSNPDYFEGKPYISKYIYRIIPDQSVQFLELKSGGIDMMGLTPDLYNNQASTNWFNSKFNKFRYPAFSYTYLGYNLLNPLFKDKKVRIAISHAINKKEIIDGVLQGCGVESTGPFPPASWAYNKELKGYEYSLAKAKKLLAEAGWKDTNNDGIIDKDGKPFEFLLMTNQGNKSRELCATIIQEQLKKIGIRVKIRIIAWSSFISEYIDKKKFDAVLLGWGLGRDPDCYDIWHSSKTSEKQYNFVSYKNPVLDKLLQEGRETFDIEKRKVIYCKIHKILAIDVPYTFLYVPDALVAIHNRIHGIKPEPIGISYNFIKWFVPEHLQKHKLTP